MAGDMRSWRIIIFVCFLLLTGAIHSQTFDLCPGNQGENIFTLGNFGSGPQNVYPFDPGIAPGFFYTTSVPPDDGEYTLTNDMAFWPFLFQGWIPTSEQTNDPNGYIMVVNASFSPGIFYQETVDGLCENTTYAFYADIINLIQQGLPNFILPNVSFLLDGDIKYTTGQIPQNNRWNTYGFSFTTEPGQTSVTLTLRNNAPGGFGNDLALDNIQFKSCGPESTISITPEGKICENSLFPELHATVATDTGYLQWQILEPGSTEFQDIIGATDRNHQIQQLAAGTYYFRFLYANTLASLGNAKCRIVSDSIIVEIVPVNFTIRDTLCDGLTYTFGDTTITTTGVYNFPFTASNGCDSIVTLELEFVPDPGIVANFQSRPPACEGAADGTISLLSVDGTRPPYSIIINDSILPPLNTIIDLPAGEYLARVETPYGCFDEETIIVQDGPVFNVDVFGSDTIRLGYPAEVSATFSLPVEQFSWFPEELAECPFCESTIVNLTDSGWIGVNATSEGGCVDGDSLFVFVDKTPVIYIPNVFTPNNDGINDQFIITVDPLVIPRIQSFYVFDRWGNMHQALTNILTTESIMGWDGKTDKGVLNPGVFAYVLTCELADGTPLVFKGDITLIH